MAPLSARQKLIRLAIVLSALGLFAVGIEYVPVLTTQIVGTGLSVVQMFPFAVGGWIGYHITRGVRLQHGIGLSLLCPLLTLVCVVGISIKVSSGEVRYVLFFLCVVGAFIGSVAALGPWAGSKSVSIPSEETLSNSSQNAQDSPKERPTKFVQGMASSGQPNHSGDKSPSNLLARAFALAKKSEYEEALHLFSKVEGSNAAYGEAGCLYKLNRPDEARSVLERCLKLDPNHAKAKQLLRALPNTPQDREVRSGKIP